MLGPYFRRISYLSSWHSYSSFNWKSLTSCWFESVNSTKGCWNSNRTCWIWTYRKSRGPCSNLRTFASWTSSCNAFWIEGILRRPINSIWALNSQKTLRNVCVGKCNASLSFEKLNNFSTFCRWLYIFTESTCFNHSINF